MTRPTAPSLEKDQRYLIHSQHYAPDHRDPIIYEHGEGRLAHRCPRPPLHRRALLAVERRRRPRPGGARRRCRRADAKVAFANGYIGYSNVPAIELAERSSTSPTTTWAASSSRTPVPSPTRARSRWRASTGTSKAARQGEADLARALLPRQHARGLPMTGLQPFWKSLRPARSRHRPHRQARQPRMRLRAQHGRRVRLTGWRRPSSARARDRRGRADGAREGRRRRLAALRRVLREGPRHSATSTRSCSSSTR
jgi:hypothetical protein